ncbi:hypothetical protein J5N97_006386 [Dioscorea zingiberensis]|uniref:Uncharacterized protein n=1 Tax=Dioscorea zingiberensis TaxID=325984 RepID=A0A9D5DC50_9LILI|nr:hypothetical protein J5N97_006386 [Dioscorea zingiberensis]
MQSDTMVCTKSSFHKWNDGQWTFDFRAESKSASAANLPSDSRSSRSSGSMTIMFYVVSETEDMIIPEPLRLEWRVEECMELAHPENSDIWLDIMALLDCMPSFPNDARDILKSQMSSEASEFMRIVSRHNHQTVKMWLEIRLYIHSSVDALSQELRQAVLDFNNSYRYVETSNEDAADNDEGHDAESLLMLATVIEKNVSSLKNQTLHNDQ